MTIKIIKGTKGEDWYCAKDVVQEAGRVWNGASQTLKKIPEHDKAILRHVSAGGDQNIWCVSAKGKSLLLSEHDPISVGCPYCMTSKGVITENSIFNDCGDPDYQKILKAAQANPSPLLIMHLLDVKGLNPEIQNLITRLDDEGQQEIRSYIEWLAETNFDKAV
jgi:hypothetical protein